MSAPNLKEIEWAIKELENQESTENRYILLAALYICRDQFLGKDLPGSRISESKDFRPLSQEPEKLDCYGESEFLQTAAGKNSAKAWAVMDELMDTLLAVNVKVYNSVIKKLKNLS